MQQHAASDCVRVPMPDAPHSSEACTHDSHVVWPVLTTTVDSCGTEPSLVDVCTRAKLASVGREATAPAQGMAVSAAATTSARTSCDGAIRMCANHSYVHRAAWCVMQGAVARGRTGPAALRRHWYIACKYLCACLRDGRNSIALVQWLPSQSRGSTVGSCVGLINQHISNPKAVGSIPTLGTMDFFFACGPGARVVQIIYRKPFEPVRALAAIGAVTARFAAATRPGELVARAERCTV